MRAALLCAGGEQCCQGRAVLSGASSAVWCEQCCLMRAVLFDATSAVRVSSAG